MKTRFDFFDKIDWTALYEQKGTLLDIMNMSCFTEKDQTDLNGILHLIDGIQDYAVDELGIDKDIVFIP